MGVAQKYPDRDSFSNQDRELWSPARYPLAHGRH